MGAVERAVWFIEHQFGSEVTLDAVAEAAGVSRFHLCRLFGVATGRSVMGYVRGRRLTEAARVLAGGASDILAVALDAGYGSHEAFTRAFRDQFGLTPEQVRGRGRADTLALVEPIRMDDTLIIDLEAPRFEAGKTLLVAGLGDRYTFETNEGIPALWQRFGPQIGHVPNEVGGAAYGVCCNTDDAGNFDYIAGVEVASFSDLPAELARVRIPARRYAVFVHRDHISRIRATHYTIWTRWLPQSGHAFADAPSFERYTADFDPWSGTGMVEIWMPIEG
jgi:AraC family transcriptional regulator